MLIYAINFHVKMELFDTTQMSFHFHNCNVIWFNWRSCDSFCLFSCRSKPAQVNSVTWKTRNSDILFLFFFHVSIYHYSKLGSWELEHIPTCTGQREVNRRAKKQNSTDKKRQHLKTENFPFPWVVGLACLPNPKKERSITILITH